MKVLYATTGMRPAPKVGSPSDRLHWSMHPGIEWVKSDNWIRDLCAPTKRAYWHKIAT